MSDYQHKDSFGNLFQNKKKENDKQPDYKGEIMLDGKLWEIAGWKKMGGKGPYLSLKGQEPRAQEGKPAERAAKNFADEDRDIPF